MKNWISDQLNNLPKAGLSEGLCPCCPSAWKLLLSLRWFGALSNISPSRLPIPYSCPSHMDPAPWLDLSLKFSCLFSKWLHTYEALYYCYCMFGWLLSVSSNLNVKPIGSGPSSALSTTWKEFRAGFMGVWSAQSHRALCSEGHHIWFNDLLLNCC